MNSEEIKKLVDIAKSSVEGQPEPIKTEAFKVILDNLLKLESIARPAESPTQTPGSISAVNTDLMSRIKSFADKCGLSVEELNDVFLIKNNSVEIVCPINGSETKKHIVVSLSVLAVFEFILGYEWVSSMTLGECLRSAGVKDLGNFSRTLTNYERYFRMRGSTKDKAYKLTSTDGRKAALETIYKLNRREEIEVDK